LVQVIRAKLCIHTLLAPQHHKLYKMQKQQYKIFSLKTHKNNWQTNKPNVCQFELTFACGLRCKHCYTDCYNNPGDIKNELSEKQIKLILDKVYNAGVLWLCFTGGDPLARKDFLDIYYYAKKKGFIITVFTNGYSMTRKIAEELKKYPPFVIEMTLNAASEELYDKISQVNGSFVKVMKGIDLILKARLPLKIKTQITKDNFKDIKKIKGFIEKLGLLFRPSFDLHARLNGDLAPCNLRLSAQEILSLDGNKDFSDSGECYSKSQEKQDRFLFRCAAGSGDGFHVDPYGNTFICNLLRKPAFNLLKFDIEYMRNKLLPLVRQMKFTTDSKCRVCNLINSCRLCPGRAYVETGNKESHVQYYCELTKII